MFKRSRIKIVASIMLVLVLLWGGTLGVIYASSYFEMTEQNREMLRVHADMYDLRRTDGVSLPQPEPAPSAGDRDFRRDFEDSPMFRLSTFYTVALSYGGEVLEIRNAQSTVYDDDTLARLAQEIVDGGKESGSRNSLAFYKKDKGGYELVAFMDNTLINESAVTLLRYTLIFGAVAMAIFLALSVFLARRIVDPLEESYKKQKRFISDAGHELKTPVSVVGACAELLSREIGDNRWLADIRYENERMGVLVGQLLELARTESVAHRAERIDLSRETAGEALPFESVAFERGLVLKCRIDSGITVVGSADRLKQLVSVLLDNAIRHSRDGGEVRLSLTREHGYACLSVINEGDGIPPEQREQIFERFWRADDARSGEDGHYGLGLAIAKAVVESHRGHIEVICENGLVEFRARIPIA